MVTVLKYSLSILCALLSVRSSAQAPLTYQVLAIEHSYVGGLAVSQFDNLLPGDTSSQGWCCHQPLPNQPFLTNIDLSAMAPKPSTLQSMLWSPLVSLMFFTFVPALMAFE